MTNPATQQHLLSQLASVLMLVVCITCSHAQTTHTTPRLSEEGQRMSDAHALLFGQLVKNYTAKFTGNNPRQLRRLELSSEKQTVDGKLDLLLSPGAERVLPMFRYVELTGQGLDKLGPISLLPIAPNVPLPVSTKTPTVYRVKLPALAIPGKDAPLAAIGLTGSGVIESVSLVPFGGGISETFDSAPYRNLGAELPILEVNVQVDTQQELSIDGHIDIDRTKWFRYYGYPNCVSESMESFAAERGFYPGRQTFKFQPALVKGYSRNQPLLREDPNRPGWSDPTFFDRYKSTQFANPYKPFEDVPFAMCLDEYPDFMSVEHTGRGTPLPEHFDAAADLAAKFFKNQVEHSGKTATYWEVKNESTIKAEWDHHWKQGVDSWGMLSKFHNKVADAVHAQVPGVKIGGPTSAWMQIQVENFKLWKNQQRFMDETRGHLDFYSHHFYEDMGTLGCFEKRSTSYRNYLLGRLEVILDMFQAHMQGTDNVRPILLTEYGALNVGKSEADYWLRLRSYSAYLTRLMHRPDQIEFAVPFVFLSSPWDPQNGHSVYVPNGNPGSYGDLSRYRKTPNAHFFDLWRDFRGRRLPVHFDSPWLSVVAVHEGRALRLALSNMGGQRLNVNIQDLVGRTIATDIKQRRLHYVDGKVVFEDAVNLKNSPVSIDPEETTIVELNLPKPLQVSDQPLVVKNSFVAQTAVTSNEANSMQVQVDDLSNAISATIHIGVQRQGGLAAPLSGTINGHAFKIDNTDQRAVPHLFECLKTELPIAQLKKSNIVAFDGQDGLTITSVRIETTHQ